MFGEVTDVEESRWLVAVVDDDESVRSAVHALFASVGMDPRSFRSAEEFLDSGLPREADCVITDINMPGMGGFELQAHLVNLGLQVPIIFITAYGDARLRARALSSGARGFFEKPFDDTALIGSVRRAVRL